MPPPSLYSSTEDSLREVIVVLVEPHQGSFALHTKVGKGAEHFPPALAPALPPHNSEQPAAKQLQEQRHAFTLLPHTAYSLHGSNWSIEDVVQSQSPWVYDCSEPGAQGLPQEAVWLRRAGVPSMVTLPCLHEGYVRGVLTLGLPCKVVPPELLAALTQLAYQVTPFIVEANPDLAPWMCQPRLQRFRSFNDIAASLLDDLVNLDKFLITSLTAPDLSSKPRTAAIAL
ncbi:hypothetical protein V8C86DRAFT_3103761 [Haematococcus lacustris]